MESTSIPPKFPSRKNKDLCLNEWLLRNSEVHPINAQRIKKHRLEHPTPAIWYGPPQHKQKHHQQRQMQPGLIQIFPRAKQRLSAQVHGAHHWDIRRSKLHRVSELLMQRAQRFACFKQGGRSPSRKTAQMYLQ